MKRSLTLTLAVVAGLAVPARADHHRARNFRAGTAVEVVGMVSSQPRDAGFVNEKKMQVAVGKDRTDYTLHLKDAKLFGYHGQEIGISDLQDKVWVRAEGRTMDDPRRITVSRLQVIGGNVPTLEYTSFERKGYEHGYVRGVPAGRGPSARPRELAENTRVVVVGKISSPPKGAVEEKKMQVAVGRGKTDYTLHFRDAQVLGLQGDRIDEDALDDGMWVRAEGRVMDDPRRIKVSRLRVIGRDDAFRRSAYHHGQDQGYVMAVAGTRQTFGGGFRPGFGMANVAIVGQVSDDTGTFESTRKIQVNAAGQEWTIHVPEGATVRNEKGETISLHEIAKGQWIHAAGVQTDDLRMRVSRVENIGRDDAYRLSRFYRREAARGYVELLAPR